MIDGALSLFDKRGLRGLLGKFSFTAKNHLLPLRVMTGKGANAIPAITFRPPTHATAAGIFLPAIPVIPVNRNSREVAT